MTIDDQIRDEKFQFNIIRESARVSVNIDKCKYLTGKEKQIIEKAKFTYYPLEKGFEKQIKLIVDQDKKKVDLKLIFWIL